MPWVLAISKDKRGWLVLNKKALTITFFYILDRLSIASATSDKGELIIMRAVLMAGGSGTRLRPLTCELPKPMVPILNRPIAEHIINLLKENNNMFSNRPI